ncbi:MAG: hypothetical protein ACI9JN_000973 [Bacteroidia bacterium]|jgi:hypothetical protein
MFIFGTSTDGISKHPLDQEALSRLQSASTVWRTKHRNYKIIAYLLIGIPILYIATQASWMELAFALLIYFGLALFAELQIQTVFLRLHKVSLQIDNEEFARPYDEDLIKPITNQNIRLVSDAAQRYMNNVGKLKRKITQLDIDIINYLNESNHHGQSI